MIYLIAAAVGALYGEILTWLLRRSPSRPKDRAQRQGGTGHLLVLVGPDRCRCGESWPCLDSVPADRRTISA